MYEVLSTLFVMIFLNLFLIFVPRVGLLNLVVGLFSILFAPLSLAVGMGLPVEFGVFFALFVAVMGVVSMWCGVDARKRLL
jgi:hypothetical protein